MKAPPRRILVIDDEPDLLEMIAFRLESSGACRVETAADGREGLEKLHASRPDLVLVDLLMPGLDGWEVQRRIRDDPELKDVPVVLLTASPLPEVRQRALKEGFRQVLPKPFDSDDLVARVRLLTAA